MDIKNKKHIENIDFYNHIINNPKLDVFIDWYDKNKFNIIIKSFIDHILCLVNDAHYIWKEKIVHDILVELEKMNYPIYKTYYLFSTIRYIFKYNVVDSIEDVKEKIDFLKHFDDITFMIDYNFIANTYETIVNEREKAHENKLEMYKRIVEHMAESVWIWDEEERTVYANPNFCKLVWYDLEEMIWRESYDFRDEESTKTVKNNNDIRKQWESSKYEWFLKSKSWEVIPVFCSWTPIPGWWTVWIMTDLREVKSLKKVEEDLKNLNSVKDEFISIVWHELRTPLTIIKWYLSMMLEGDTWDFSPLAKKAIWHSLESTNWLIILVNDMLDLSKMSSWNMVYNDEKTDIIDLSLKLHHDLDIIAKQKWIEFSFLIEWKFEDKYIIIDPNKLKQVIINLVNNAFKFTKKWGFVNLKLIDLWDSLIIEVEDNWIWMCKDKLDKIFDKFYQIDSYIQRSTDWLWLWLAISQWIINNYDSKINVESQEWVGTKFFFELKKQ